MFQETETIDLSDFQDGCQQPPEPHQRVSAPHQCGISDAEADASGIEFPASMKAVCQQIKAELSFGFSENTLRSRWMPEKILPIYENLDVPAIKNERGLVTEFGFQVIRDYLVHTVIPKSGKDTDRMSLEAYAEYIRTLYSPKAEKPDNSVHPGSFLEEDDYLEPSDLIVWEQASADMEVSRRKANASKSAKSIQKSVNNYAKAFLSQFDVIGEQLGARALERINAKAEAVVSEGLENSAETLHIATKKPSSPDKPSA